MKLKLLFLFFVCYFAPLLRAQLLPSTIEANTDTYINQYSAGSSYGSLSTLLVEHRLESCDCYCGCINIFGCWCSKTCYTCHYRARAFMKFDVNSLQFKCIKSAKLEITYSSGSTTLSGYTMHTTNTGWTNTMNANTEGSVGYTISGSPSSVGVTWTNIGSNKWQVSVPANWIMDAINLRGGILSLRLERTTTSTTSTYFSSVEGSSRPKLQLQYYTCGHYCQYGQGDVYSDECRCNSGFLLNANGYSCDNIDDCGGHGCQNGGICIDGINSYTCDCSGTDFTGPYCQTRIDDCLGVSCLNGGKCADLHRTYRCDCAPGWEGKHCQTNINECVTMGVICQNDGKCVDMINNYYCDCPSNYEGKHCEKVKDGCQEGTTPKCLNGGICHNNPPGYTCQCDPGWTGSNCEVDIDECAITPCDNGGICIDQIGKRTCDCSQIDYTGTDCSVHINDCVEGKYDCSGRGKCLDGIRSYTCDCDPGRAGDHCEIDINECAPNPCGNFVHECINGDNSYTCVCQIGYGLDDDKQCNAAVLCDSINPSDAGKDHGFAGWPSVQASLDKVETECAPGYYYINKKPSRMCLQPSSGLVGTWGAVSDPCLRLKCPAQNLNSIQWKETDSMTYAEEPCPNGWTSDNGGKTKRWCDEFGTWSAVEDQCYKKKCTTATMHNAIFPATDAGSLAVGSCIAGYAGAIQLRCVIPTQAGHDPAWDIAPIGKCDLADVTCPPEIVNATYSYREYVRTALGVTVTHPCDLNAVGTVERTCLAGGKWGNEVENCDTLPDKLSNVTVTDIRHTTVTLEWDTDFLRRDVAATKYRVLTSADLINYDICCNGAGADLVDGTGTFTVFGLTPFKKFGIRVLSGNDAGYETFGVTVEVETQIAPPNSLRTTNVGNTTISLAWNADPTAQWFHVYMKSEDTPKDFAPNGYKISDQFITIVGLRADTEYEFDVRSGRALSYYEQNYFENTGVQGVFRTESNEGPTDTPTDKPFTNNPFTQNKDLGVIVGCLVAGLLVVVLILIAIVILIRKKNRLEEERQLELKNLSGTMMRGGYSGTMGGFSGTMGGGFSGTMAGGFGGTMGGPGWGGTMGGGAPGWGGTMGAGWGGTMGGGWGGTMGGGFGGTMGGGFGMPPSRPDFTNYSAASSGYSMNSGTMGGMPGRAPPSYNPMDQTMVNTQMEMALPGFLLMDYHKDIQISGPIGGGGAGSVYSGVLLNEYVIKQFNGIQQVAVKQVANRERFDDATNRQFFHQEVSILWSLAFNPHVMKLVGYTEEPRCIITKLYQTDLYQFLKNPAEDVTPMLAANLTGQIASGFSAIHQMGVIHRDVKSSNILLEMVSTPMGPTINAVICDFGLAKVVTHHGVAAANQINVIGLSPRYCAPEVFSRSHVGSANVDPEEEKRADVYSFAIIIWELLTRETPWANVDPSKIEVFVRSGSRPEVPDSYGDPYRQLLIDIMQLCWVERPMERPSFVQISQRLSMM